MTPDVWVPLAAILMGSGGVGWFLALEQRRKLQTDNAKSNIDALILFRQQLNEITAENIQLRQEFEAFRIETNARLSSRDEHIAALTAHVGRLEMEVARLGGQVPPRPWPIAP